MQQLTLRLGLALLTFTLGIVVYAAKVFVSVPADEIACPVAQLEQEKWHKLYEAAGMTGDAGTLRLVREKLMCTNPDGISDARAVQLAEDTWCKRADGTVHEYNTVLGPYGQYHRMIMDSHRAWSLKHLTFLYSLIPSERARVYVNGHL